jgi:hypothetical protein
MVSVAERLALSTVARALRTLADAIEKYVKALE